MAPGRGLRVLLVSIVDPARRRGGAWTVTRGLVELLGREPWTAELTVVAADEPRWPALRRATSLACAPWTGVPAKVRYLRTRAFVARVREALGRGHHDLVVINGSDLLGCLADVPRGTPTLAVVHNREARLYRDQVDATLPRAGPLSAWLKHDGERLERYEREWLARAGAAIFLSQDEADEFARELPGLDALVLPPLFAQPPTRVAKAANGRLDLGLLADFAWWPNRDAARWFVREVLDRVGGDVRLHLYGHRSGEVVRPHPRVAMHGFVDDLARVWSSCDGMVVPIRYGAGVSVKVAESLYHGMPVASTRHGLRGLPPFDHPQVVRCDSADEWIGFLSGARARSWSAGRLPIEASLPFDLAANASRFDAFLARVLERR
ncbi:MAG: glycosyltransferase [Burkholderiales bacterium]|nr:glycosyltransferase [Burkholderiales bacterium]